jgi:tetratricopeptide (TPR) repeat protein
MEYGAIETDLDRLSNSVQDAIEARAYDEAEKICQRLLIEYPEVIDGHHRLAMLREIQGRYQEAAEEYSKVLDMIRQQPEGFDQEAITEFTEQRAKLLTKAKG